MLPPRHNGLRMSNFAVNCLGEKAVFLLACWDFQYAAASMMEQAYEAFIVEVCLSENVLTRNFALPGCLSMKGTRFHNLWEFCHHLKLTVDLDPSYHIQLERSSDVSIVDKFIQIGIHGKQLEILNQVRHFKKHFFCQILSTMMVALVSTWYWTTMKATHINVFQKKTDLT